MIAIPVLVFQERETMQVHMKKLYDKNVLLNNSIVQKNACPFTCTHYYEHTLLEISPFPNWYLG